MANIELELDYIDPTTQSPIKIIGINADVNLAQIAQLIASSLPAPLPVAIATGLANNPAAMQILAEAINPYLIAINGTPTPPVQPPVFPDLKPGVNSPMNGAMLFGAGFSLNQSIAAAPLSPRSTGVIASLASARFHVDASIPYNIVDSSVVAGKMLLVEDPDDSDDVPFHLAGCAMEGTVGDGGDDHCLALDMRTGVIEETYAYAGADADGNLHAYAGVVFDATSATSGRTYGRSSATASGLPVLYGILKFNEAASGFINHALRFTANPSFAREVVGPATHQAGSSSSPDAIVMGDRIRLKANLDISGFPPVAKTIAACLQTYGGYMDDNGSNMFFSADRDPQWLLEDLSALQALTADDFELADVGEPFSIDIATSLGTGPTIYSFVGAKNAQGLLEFSYNVTGADILYIEGIGVVRGSSALATYKAGSYTLVAQNLYGIVSAEATLS